MGENGKRVVCIEDEPEMIDLVRLILGRRGRPQQKQTDGCQFNPVAELHGRIIASAVFQEPPGGKQKAGPSWPRRR